MDSYKPNKSVAEIEAMLTEFWTNIMPKQKRQVSYFCKGHQRIQDVTQGLCDDPGCLCAVIANKVKNEFDTSGIS